MLSLIAAALVFGTSAAVLMLEILAGRLLAPFVGVSLETYTGIIGTTLAGISLGTWLGGRAADRTDPRLLLGPLLLAGGVLALLIVPLIAFVAGTRPEEGPVGIVLYAAVAFLAPSAVLSAVTPTVVKLQLDDLARTGRVVGRTSALATAGAIAGTFLTGFVLIAALPTRPIVLGLGVVLVIVGVAVWVVVGRGRGVRVPLAALALVAGGVSWSSVTPQACQRESAYFCVRVEQDPARGTGRTLYLDTLRHSYVDLADPTHLEFTYAQVVGDVMAVMAPDGEPILALFVGGGGFTLPRYVTATRPGSVSRVLELDPTVVAVARDELGLVTSETLTVRVGDARLGIADEPAGAYDLVVGDAFSGLAVPWHLTTREMLHEVRRVMRPGGLYVINLIDYPPLGFARAEAATLRDVFRHVAVIAPQERIEGRAGGGLILIGSDGPIPAQAILARNRLRRDDDSIVTPGAGLEDFIGDAGILTDDFAPVDQLISPPR